MLENYVAMLMHIIGKQIINLLYLSSPIIWAFFHLRCSLGRDVYRLACVWYEPDGRLIALW